MTARFLRTAAGTRFDVILVLILLGALAFRVYLGVTARYIYDEINNAIPLAETISFAPHSLHLPLRGRNHGALPAYVVKASASLFGKSALGYRAGHIILGLFTIWLVYLLTRQWYGVVAGRWAASLLAFNEYYLPVSARVTAQTPFLFLMAVGLYAFSRFLATERARYLYLAGAGVGLAFYCKEHAALILPVFLLTLMHPKLRHWLRGPHVYLAAAVFALVIAPDLYWNVSTPADTKASYGEQEALQVHYTDHLQRVGGIGFSPYPFMFYGRSAVMPLYQSVTGRPLIDRTDEYPSINPALGILLLGAVVATTFLARGRDPASAFLLLTFWCVFGLFSVITQGNPRGGIDPISWIWVEVTMFPAIILTGARLAERGGRARLVTWAACGAALVYGVVQFLTHHGFRA